MLPGMSVSCIMEQVNNPLAYDARTRRLIVSSSVSLYSLD
jgi:hypothetical protein